MRAGNIIYVVPALLCLCVSSLCADMRGAWVTAWNPGYFTPHEAEATIKAAKSAGLNTLFIQVRKQADAYYNSSLESRAPEIAADYDPLAYVIEKAHAQGIEVHAWMNVFRVWRDSALPTDAGHMVNLHRDWLTKNFTGELHASDGYFFDPGIPEVREHNATVAAEIASKYDVDGVHLDYIRYPGREWGYADAALSRYYAETGATTKPDPTDPCWLQWRREQVTAQVRLIREKVKAIKSNVVISAATIAWGDCPADFCCSTPYAKVCQDWKAWMETGLLDANLLMNYKIEKNPQHARMFRNWLKGLKKWSGQTPVYAGINVIMNKPAQTLRQIAAAKKAGLSGFVLFAFNMTPERAGLVRALGR